MRPADLAALARERVVLLDGGVGSMLIAAGLEAGRAPESWVLEHPERVAAVHRAYAEAGSDIVHACTFGATPPRLAAAGLEGRCREVNAGAVRLAREAVGGRALVAGDIGPTGTFLPPVGAATTESLRAAFEAQAAALAEAGADLLSIETMSDLREARLALEAGRRTGLAVIASMTFEPRRRGVFTVMGDALVASLLALAEDGAGAVGCNCSVEPGPMLAMVREAAPRLPVPMAAQPNAGRPRLTAGGVVYDADPAAFAAAVKAMAEDGARLVGGCCGTTPAFIRAARAALDAGV
ncbi:MAG: homocysteine S-methyltransferase family protein [Acidobacteriota bacterium]